jgi:hypothetical protein
MERIKIIQSAESPWPFEAVLEQTGDYGEWVEVETEGGDTPDEAVATLREECRAARGVEVA